MCLLQTELDLEKGLEMRKWVLSGILASEETYLSHLEALLLVRDWNTHTGLSINALCITYTYTHSTNSLSLTCSLSL